MPRGRQLPAVLAALVVSAAGGCATLRAPADGLAMPSPAGKHVANKPQATIPPGGAVVFVADGAGNFQAASDALRKAVALDHAHIEVVTFPWSHGYCRILSDQLGFRHAQAQGKRLALEVEAFARQHPHVPIYLVGHSAGATVVLSALENLPPGLVERAMLLSPSISSRYDVRPALNAVSHGLHVYYSEHDFYYLGLATHLIGTADRHFFQSASGRVGFQVDDDMVVGLKLHQRPWQPGDQATGNLGGHFGNYQPQFVRKAVLPLIVAVKS